VNTEGINHVDILRKISGEKTAGAKVLRQKISEVLLQQQISMSGVQRTRWAARK
jgi:hypothetical protein